MFCLEAVRHRHVVVVALHHECAGAAEQRLVLEATHADRVLARGGVGGDLHVVVAHCNFRIRTQRGVGGRRNVRDVLRSIGTWERRYSV